MANTYNGIPRAPVIFVSGGNARVVVRRERPEELFDRDV
jgi:diaminopimelate decarboxylase